MLKDEYRAGVEQLAPMAKAVREAIASERERAADMEAESEAIEHSDQDSTIDADEHENKYMMCSVHHILELNLNRRWVRERDGVD